MSATLNISWTAPTTGAGIAKTVTSYTIGYRIQGTSTYTVVTGIVGTTHSISGLVNGVVYEGYIKSICNSCESSIVTFSGNPIDCSFSGSAVKLDTSGYYDCGYGCQHYDTNPGGGCTSCVPPTPTPTPTPTAVPATATPTPTPTPTAVPVTPTPTPTPTADTSGYYDCGYGCQYYASNPGCNTCDPNVTPTPTPVGATPTPTPTYYVVRRCDNSVTGITVNTPTGFLTTGHTYTLTGSHPQMDGVLCWEVTGIVHTGLQYNVSYNGEYNNCSSCTTTYFDGYTGSTATIACNQTNPLRIYYRGSLGTNSVLYTESTMVTTVPTPGFYWYNSDVVLHVGLPSVEDGRVTEVVSCPVIVTPTPTPAPQGITAFGKCGDSTTTIYYKYGNTYGAKVLDSDGNCYENFNEFNAYEDLQAYYSSNPLTEIPTIQSSSSNCPCN